MRLKSKKIDPTIARMINPIGGGPSKVPVNPNISKGELIKNIAPN
jgi:hypothetical protein